MPVGTGAVLCRCRVVGKPAAVDAADEQQDRPTHRHAHFGPSPRQCRIEEHHLRHGARRIKHHRERLPWIVSGEGGVAIVPGKGGGAESLGPHARPGKVDRHPIAEGLKGPDRCRLAVDREAVPGGRSTGGRRRRPDRVGGGLPCFGAEAGLGAVGRGEIATLQREQIGTLADLDQIAVGDQWPPLGARSKGGDRQARHLGDVGPTPREGQLDRIGGLERRREADRRGERVAAVGLGALRDRQIDGRGA